MEIVRNMTERPGKQLGAYIRQHRQARHMTGRELAHRVGINDGHLVRVERGEFKAPSPQTLARIAQELHLPLGDIYGVAGYLVPIELPSLPVYLRTRYKELTAADIKELHTYFRDYAARKGFQLDGPAPGEDEVAYTRPEEIDPADLV